MSIASLSLLEGATITPSGGTALAFNASVPYNGSVKAYCTTDTDLRSRRTIDFSVKEPKVSPSAPAGYTQARANTFIRAPLALDNGSSTTNTVSIGFSFDPETTQAEVLELRKLAVLAIIDSDLDGFYNNLSLA